MPVENQPLSRLRWVHRDTLTPNNYNPNHVAKPELELLIVSIVSDGWTQPIVVTEDLTHIVDGFHRWSVSADPRVYALTGGMIPIVPITADEAGRVCATVRHNRARGEHGVDPMSGIVRGLTDAGVEDGAILRALGMEAEELDRLRELRGSPARVTASAGGPSKAWVPGKRFRKGDPKG